MRDLERRAEQGDTDAAEELYWKGLRSGLSMKLLDKLVEAVLTLDNGVSPTVWQKLSFTRDQPLEVLPPAEAAAERERWRLVQSASQLHQIPRSVRAPGFTTYVVSDWSVYQVQADGNWLRLVTLSAPPPCHPFHIVQQLSDRDALQITSRASCFVLQNGGVYIGERPSHGSVNQTDPNVRVRWVDVRFEKRRAARPQEV